MFTLDVLQSLITPSDVTDDHDDEGSVILASKSWSLVELEALCLLIRHKGMDNDVIGLEEHIALRRAVTCVMSYAELQVMILDYDQRLKREVSAIVQEDIDICLLTDKRSRFGTQRVPEAAAMDQLLREQHAILSTELQMDLQSKGCALSLQHLAKGLFDMCLFDIDLQTAIKQAEINTFLTIRTSRC